MTTSGTINRTKITVSELLEKSFGKARIKPQQITAEMLDIARADLDDYLKTITENGVKLWSYERSILTMKQGHQHVDLPEGTSDVESVALRKFSFALPASILQGATNLLPLLGDAGNPTVFSDPIVFTSPTPLQGDYELHLSFLGDVNRKLKVSFSTNGITYTAPSFLVPDVDLNVKTYKDREYDVFDLVLPIGTNVIKIEDDNGLAMQIFDLMLVRGGQETILHPWGDDQIARTGNAFRGGNPTNYFARRLVDKTSLMLWPVPTEMTADQFDLVVWRKRQIMDAGRMTNTLDIPSRWVEAIVWQNGWRIAQREPEAQAEWRDVKGVADEIEMKARETERVKGPIKINFRRR